MIDFENWCRQNGHPDYRIRQFKLANDEDYSVYFCKAKTKSRSQTSTAIVFLHATGNSAWFPQACLMDSLTDSGFNFFSVQLPGHGQKDTSILRFEQLGRFVEHACLNLKANFDLKDFVLVGQSLGAIAIAQYLSQSPTIEGLLGASLITMPMQPGMRISAALPELLLPFFGGFWRLAKCYGLLSTIPAFGSYRRDEFPVRIDPAYSRLSYIKYVSSAICREDWPSRLQGVRQHLLAVYAACDRIAPPKEGLRLKQVLPHLELATIKAENHFSIMGSRILPELIKTWIKGIRPASS